MWVNNKTIVVLPLQQWLRERASMLHYTYIAYLFVDTNHCCKDYWAM
jgi:hypothetical protein